MTTKRQKVNHETNGFQKPYSLFENLEGSVKYLDATVNKLKTTVNSLDLVTNEFNRQCSGAKHIRNYDLVTERDIELVKEEFKNQFSGDIQSQLDNIQAALDALELTEQKLAQEVDEQEKMLKGLKKENAAKSSANQDRSQSGSPQDPPVTNTRLEQIKKQKLKTQRLIKAEKDLIEQNVKEIKRIDQESKELADELEQHISYQSTTDLNRTADTIEPSEAKRKQIELNKTLLELKRQASVKQELVQMRRLQTRGDGVEKTTYIANPLKTETMIADPPFADYKQVIETTLKEINQPRFSASKAAIEGCEAQGIKCLEFLQQENKNVARQVAQAKQLGQHLIKTVKSLFKLYMPDQMYGKTAGKLIEMMLAQQNHKIPIHDLLKEFPSNREKRHNFTKVTHVLIQAGILEISGTNLILRDRL